MTDDRCTWEWAYGTVAGVVLCCRCGRSRYIPHTTPDYHSLGGELMRLQASFRRLRRAVFPWQPR